MATKPGNASNNLPGQPPVVDLATWQAAREELTLTPRRLRAASGTTQRCSSQGARGG